MRYTQFLIFESGRECNLGASHTRCPNLNPLRCEHCDTSRPLTDEKIIDACDQAYNSLGFRGLIGWHYYNEPLMTRDRILPLMTKIRARVSTARFVLWTNGDLLPKSGPELESLRAFDMAWVTIYGTDRYKQIRGVIPATTFCRWQLDGRADVQTKIHDFKPCARPFTELPFDFYGNLHLCCMDWRGTTRIGNLHDTPLSELVKRFTTLRDRLAGESLPSDAPDCCTHCVAKHATPAGLVKNISGDASKYVVDLRAACARKRGEKRAQSALSSRTTNRFLVVPAFRIPAQRVAEHFKHNDDLYKSADVIPLLIVDKMYDPQIVGSARQLVYPEPMLRFSNCRAKNYGIRFAAESGATVIITADIDVVFTRECLFECINVVRGHSVVPVYRMIQTMDEPGDVVIADKATGVVAMLTEDWRVAHYNEESAGYGADDSLLLHAIRSAGIRIIRATGVLWHLAHQPGTPQREFKGRTDHWGRADGFFPEAFAENNRLQRSSAGIDRSPRWGLPYAVSDVSVVLTHYRMPMRRLQEWIEWNENIIRAMRARVVVVSDIRSYGIALPDWMTIARFPRSLSIFNLSATSNFGIRLVGRGTIAKVDPDLFLGEKFPDTVVAVNDARGVSPVYRMASSSQEARDGKGEIWEASKGCLIMTWRRWAEINGFDERMIGYGIEDGDAFCRAQKLPNHTVDRICEPVWHVAHSSTPQLTGNQRTDCWGRANGFNPHRHRKNMDARRSPWSSPTWGQGQEIDTARSNLPRQVVAG